MEFFLTYDGPLASNGNPRKKHAIRQYLHPQLKELWDHGALRDYLTQTELGGTVRTEVGGHGFTAIVHPYFNFSARLDILILRPEPPGTILAGQGDIDNRLKTLFDSLTRPTQAQDLPRDWAPTSTETPIHCLLEDDGFITSVNVETGRLLNAQTASHSRITIKVAVQTRNAFGGLAILAP